MLYAGSPYASVPYASLDTAVTVSVFPEALSILVSIEAPTVYINENTTILPSPFALEFTIHEPDYFTDEPTADLAIVATVLPPTIVMIEQVIRIYINEYEVTDQVAFPTLEVTANLYSDPDTASMEVVNSPLKSYIPEPLDEITIFDGASKIFGGILIRKRQEMDGYLERYVLEFKDWSEILSTTIVGEEYAAMTIQDIIGDIDSTYLTGFDVTNVVDTTPIDYIAFDNISVSECLDRLAEISNKRWYVSPDKEIYFFDPTTISAPVSFTDTSGTYEWSSLQLDYDFTQIANRITIKGNGIEAVVAEDMVSQALYGVKEYFERDNEITNTAEAESKAEGILSTMKDPVRIVSFRTKYPGLYTGQQIIVESAIRGINETLNIQEIRFQSLSPLKFMYEVRASSQRLNGLEDMIAKQQIVPDNSLSIGNQSNLFDISFSAIDDETIQWSAGTITLSDGTQYSIDADTSEVLTADHIIYFDPEASETELQISTTFTDGMGNKKIPLAYASKSGVATKFATIFPIGMGGRMQLDGGVHITDRSILADNIAANAITANEIAANTITANKMDVDELSAITATMGTLNLVDTTTGANVQLDATSRRLSFIYDNDPKAYIYCDSSGNLVIDADNLVYIRADGTGDDIWLESGDNIFSTTPNGAFFHQGNSFVATVTGNFLISECDEMYVWYNSDNTEGECHWVDDNTNSERMNLSDEGNLSIAGDFSADNFDFAEFFESASGEAIPNGVSVVIVGKGMIRPAKEGEEPIGVISATAGAVLNNGGADASKSWGGKYLRDDFGAIVFEEAEWWRAEYIEETIKETGQKIALTKRVSGWSDTDTPPEGSKILKKVLSKRRKVNPNYDPERPFVPRRKRAEWNIVGLIGRVRIRKDQPVAKTWVKLFDVSNEVAEWLIK